MHPSSIPDFHQHLAGEFLKIFPPSAGWLPAAPESMSKAGYDLLLWRKNGRVTEKIVGFWVKELPPSPVTLQQLNIIVRKSAGRYAKISAKYLISHQPLPQSAQLEGFHLFQLTPPGLQTI